MGGCQSRESIQQVATNPQADVRSIGSGSLASEKSETTVAVSNQQQHHQVVGTPIQEENEDDLNGEDSGEEEEDDGNDAELESASSDNGSTSGPVDPPVMVQDKNQGKERSKSEEKKSKRDPDGGYKASNRSTHQTPGNTPDFKKNAECEETSSSTEDSSKSTTKSMLVGAPETQRSLFSKPQSSQASAPSAGIAAAPGTPAKPGRPPKDQSSGKRSGKSRKAPPLPSFSLARATISEEEDPEMPSDEEDFREELVRNTPNDEPGRLLPVKLKTRPTTRVESVGVAGGPAGGETIPPGDLNSVQLHTLSEFQRLKLQVKLQKHQEMKERRVHKVEDRIQDSQTYKKLWEDYKRTEEELARLEQDIPRKPRDRGDSFDLKDTDSWYFDFQSVEASMPAAATEEDDGSQASLSLLSEASLDAQKRYYAEKRRKRKEKKKQSKLEKKQPGQGSTSGAAMETVATTPDGLARLNNSTHSASAAPTRDYGPARENHYRVNPNGTTTPLNVEVSFQNGSSQTDDAGSYVSDLGDESWTGGAIGNGSVSGAFGQQGVGGNTPMRPNDYGVKRRLRPGGHSGYSQQDHVLIQSKLKSLEQSLAQMRNARESTESSQVTENSAPVPASSKEVGTGKYAGVPLEELIKKLDAASKSTSKDKAEEETERELALQIQQAIRASNTKSYKKKSHKDRRKKENVKEKPSPIDELTATASKNAGIASDQELPEPSSPPDTSKRYSKGVAQRIPEPFSTPSVKDAAHIVDSQDSVTASLMAVMHSPQDTSFRPESGRRLFDECETQSNIASEELGDSTNVGGCDDMSYATGPLVACDSADTEEKKEDDIFQPRLHRNNPSEKQVRSDDDDGSKSRASSVRDPVIASMSKEEFFRMRYANPVADKNVYKQEADRDNNRPSEEGYEGDGNIDTSIEADAQGPCLPASFWSEDLDGILLKNIIPERTQVVEENDANEPVTPYTQNREDPPPSLTLWRDEMDEIILKNYIPKRTDISSDRKFNSNSMPMTAVVTPDTTPASIFNKFGGLSPDDDELSVNQPQSRYLPDPDGRRMDMLEASDLLVEPA